MRFVTWKAQPAAGGAALVLLNLLLSITRLHAVPGNVDLTGLVLDPSGKVVAGASITIVNAATGDTRTVVSDRAGQYKIPGLPGGRYRLQAVFPGFAISYREVTLDETGPRNLDVLLKLAVRRESLTITSASPGASIPLAGIRRDVDAGDQARSLSAAELLVDVPGWSLRNSGALASIPILHGLDDERVKIVANGMTVSPTCANHMDPPLSTIAPSAVAQVSVMAGITPVSSGGDSIAGTIVVDSPQPAFAAPGETIHTEGLFSSFYRSNGGGYGPSLAASISTNHLSLGYSGTLTNTDRYRDGHGHQVTSTYSQNTNHVVTMAAQGAGNLFGVQAGFQNTPAEGFPNQQMDIVGNRSEFVNAWYRRNLGAGLLDARVFWRHVRQEMNTGKDKSTFPMAMNMPMDTHSQDTGYTAKWAIPVASRHTVQVGSELQRFALDSTWPAVPGMEPTTGPNAFISMNDGRRSRLGFFAEANSRWTDRWTTLLGIRNETVWTNAGPVSGYSEMYSMAADAFNALSRARTDNAIDVTAIARYEPNALVAFEMGYARKVRAPNLYERYAWSTDWMTTSMINWFGDANSYVGNVDLRPEVAHTVSGTVRWRDPAREEWELKVTPYQTYVRDYIDVNHLATQTSGMSTFSQLMFANHDARIWGVDVSGTAAIWNSAKYGRGELTGVGGWLHGRRIDTGTGLYQMMPLNARLGLNETVKGFTGGPEIQLVGRKRDTDPLRLEQTTPGYALVNIKASYQWRPLRLEAGGSNLLNRWYELPLGGVNFDDFLAGGAMGQLMPLTGPGRSFYLGMSIPF